jgi:hypothetical protein
VFQLLQAVLGLTVDWAAGSVRFARPTLPAAFDQISIPGIELREGSIDLRLERSGETPELRVLRACEGRRQITQTWRSSTAPAGSILMRLREYDRKRTSRARAAQAPRRTSRRKARESSSAAPLGFVVQQHAARRMPGFRPSSTDVEELGGAEGADLVAGERRMAAQTEGPRWNGHGFEGVIRRGAYGGGQSSSVWDRTWQPIGDRGAASLRASSASRSRGEAARRPGISCG